MAALAGACTVAGLLIHGETAAAQTISNTAGVATVNGSLPTSTLNKLDSQIVLALKQSRGEAPFDAPTSLRPDIPIRDGDRVLIDLDATVSQDLLNQVTLLGGKIARSPDTNHIVRAMIPLSQVEALASRADVKSISPAILTVTTVIKAPPGESITKP